MSLATLHPYRIQHEDNAPDQNAVSPTGTGLSNQPFMHDLMNSPLRPAVKRPTNRSREHLSAVTPAACTIEIRTFRAQSELTQRPLLQSDSTVEDDTNSLLMIDPDEIGSFVPDNIFEMRVRLLPSQEGRFTPVEWDEVDDEIFDV